MSVRWWRADNVYRWATHKRETWHIRLELGAFRLDLRVTPEIVPAYMRDGRKFSGKGHLEVKP